MRTIARLLLPILAFAAVPAAAQGIAYADVTQDAVVAQAAVLADAANSEELTAERLLATYRRAAVPQAVAIYGPFRVIDARRAALVGITDAATPGQFAAMMRAHPGIAVLEMIECPGTEDDRANLRLGLMLHAKGVATHVPDGGFVASGAVELFLAGKTRSAERAALFAVHSWEDDQGRQARDYAPDAPKNRAYLDYYRAVGLTLAEAAAFYAMTNSVPFESARWLSRGELARWVRVDRPVETRQAPQPPLAGSFQLAVLDSSGVVH